MKMKHYVAALMAVVLMGFASKATAQQSYEEVTWKIDY